MGMASDILQPEGDDTARISWNVRRIIAKYQETFSVIEKVTILCPYSVYGNICIEYHIWDISNMGIILKSSYKNEDSFFMHI